MISCKMKYCSSWSLLVLCCLKICLAFLDSCDFVACAPPPLVCLVVGSALLCCGIRVLSSAGYCWICSHARWMHSPVSAPLCAILTFWSSICQNHCRAACRPAMVPSDIWRRVALCCSCAIQSTIMFPRCGESYHRSVANKSPLTSLYLRLFGMNFLGPFWPVLCLQCPPPVVFAISQILSCCLWCTLVPCLLLSLYLVSCPY